MFRMKSLRAKPEPTHVSRHWIPSGNPTSHSPTWRTHERRFAQLPPLDVENIAARGHAKVLDHYHQILRSQGLTPEERADIEARIAREERYWIDYQGRSPQG